MASFYKRGKQTVQVKVNIRGVKASKTFDNMDEARAWAAEEESRLRTRMKLASGFTFGMILEKYIEHYGARLEKKGYKNDPAICHLKRFSGDFVAIEITDMTKEWWLEMVQAWGVMPSSANRYLIYMSSALRYAETWLNVHVDWKAFRAAKRILNSEGVVGTGAERNRRLQPGELERLKAAIGPKTAVPLADIMDLAILTALRVNEICNLKWADFNEVTKMILVRNRKHPRDKMKNNTHLALLKNASAIIKRQPTRGTNARIFPCRSTYVSQLFGLTTAAAKVEDFHFHDFRHEAISRLFEEGYAIQQVALISGHKDWKQLMRYTNLREEDLHKGPVALQAQITRQWDKAA
jgi:integrase